MSPGRDLRGARTTIAIIAVLTVLFDVFIMVEMERFQLAIVGRATVTLVLLYLVYLGRRWARMLVVVFFVFSSLINAPALFSLGLSYWGLVTGAWISFHLAAAGIVIFSPSITRLVSRVTEPYAIDELEDEDDELANPSETEAGERRAMR